MGRGGDVHRCGQTAVALAHLSEKLELRPLTEKYTAAQRAHPVPAALCVLAMDPDSRVRIKVARQSHHLVCVDTWLVLLDDAERNVTSALLKSLPRLDRDFAAALARRAAKRGKLLLAREKLLCEEASLVLASEGDVDVRVALASHSTFKSILQQLLRDEEPDVRLAVLRNGLNSGELALELVDDPDRSVSAAAHQILGEWERSRANDEQFRRKRDQESNGNPIDE